jgi:hypothetical protein
VLHKGIDEQRLDTLRECILVPREGRRRCTELLIELVQDRARDPYTSSFARGSIRGSMVRDFRAFGVAHFEAEASARRAVFEANYAPPADPAISPRLHMLGRFLEAHPRDLGENRAIYARRINRVLQMHRLQISADELIRLILWSTTR